MSKKEALYVKFGSNDDLLEQAMLKLADILLNMTCRAASGRAGVPAKLRGFTVTRPQRDSHLYCLFLKASLALLAGSEPPEALSDA